MEQGRTIMELVSSYDAYASASELGTVVAEAPATTWICVSIASLVSISAGATYEATC